MRRGSGESARNGLAWNGPEPPGAAATRRCREKGQESAKKKATPRGDLKNAPGEIRTPDPLIRSQML